MLELGFEDGVLAFAGDVARRDVRISPKPRDRCNERIYVPCAFKIHPHRGLAVYPEIVNGGEVKDVGRLGDDSFAVVAGHAEVGQRYIAFDQCKIVERR